MRPVTSKLFFKHSSVLVQARLVDGTRDFKASTNLGFYLFSRIIEMLRPDATTHDFDVLVEE